MTQATSGVETTVRRPLLGLRPPSQAPEHGALGNREENLDEEERGGTLT